VITKPRYPRTTRGSFGERGVVDSCNPDQLYLRPVQICPIRIRLTHAYPDHLTKVFDR